jgi:hypothetical protein
MKPEYDYSNGERNRFYRPDATHEFPVYLESDVREGLERLARARDMDIEDLVNTWLRMNIAMVESKRSAA